MKSSKYFYLWMFWLVIIIANIGSAYASKARWGKDYFPNVSLITQDGETVKFFDDLIKDKIVAINFIYTSCPDSCPLETAQLKKVQDILGDRLGQDVFFYSISVDPEVDTPPVLKKYKEKFGAKWTFLTGDNDDIIELRKKLGLYIEEIQDGSNNHNVSLIIGNQTTGRWMKRSPFENAYVLADQIGNWLTGWKSAKQGDDYANAPELRNISAGEQLYRTRCATCHSITGKELPDALGPDLLGVTDRRETNWILNWLRAPDQMLAKKDPIAMALYKKYNNLAMPNMRLNKEEALNLIIYMELETQRIENGGQELASEWTADAPAKQNVAGASEDVVAVMNAWVREALPSSTTNAGYMTLINVNSESVELEKVESEAFKNIEIHEMSFEDGMMKMGELTDLRIRPNGHLKLAPGGKHLMLKEPRKDFVKGEKIDLTLTFKSGKKQIVSVKVEAR